VDLKSVVRVLVLAGLCAAMGASSSAGAARPDPTAEFPARPESEATAEALAGAVHGDWTGVKNTGSMLPVLSANDLVVTRPVDIRDVRVGDIVVFVIPATKLPNGQPIQHRRVVHRVVQRLDCERRHADGDAPPDCFRLRTQGDNVTTPDRYTTTQANLEGRVAYVVDGRTAAVRDMRASRAGLPIATMEALRRELGPERSRGLLVAEAVRGITGP
jgi:hypothetical protein